jgi:hypothetical protein
VFEPDSIYLDSFYAQGIAMELGLPDLIDLQRARIHLNNVLDQFTRFRDTNGNIMSAPTILKPDFSFYADGTEFNECILGLAYLASAEGVRIGKRLGDESLVAKALVVGEGVAFQCFNVENNGFAFATPESWYITDVTVSRFPSYSRTRSVWSLLDAVSPI